jgi:hypothetical protein
MSSELRREELAELRQVHQQITETKQLFEHTAGSAFSSIAEIRPPESASDYLVKALPDAAYPPRRQKKRAQSPHATNLPGPRPRRPLHAKAMSEPAANPNPEGGFVSHLIELRNRLMYALGAVGIVFLALVPFSNQVYAIIAQPLMDVLPAGMSMIATEVASPFLTPLKFTLAAAVTLTIPVLLYQVWAFVAPGLYKHEKRRVVPLVVSACYVLYRYGIRLLCRVSDGVQVVRGYSAAGRADDDRHQVISRFCVLHVLRLRSGLEVPVAVVILSSPDGESGTTPKNARM